MALSILDALACIPEGQRFLWHIIVGDTDGVGNVPMLLASKAGLLAE